MNRTDNISMSVIKDALSVCGGLYSMNAPYAIGYAFNPKNDGRSVAEGMFIDRHDECTNTRWTGYVSFEDKTLTDLDSKQIISLQYYMVKG